MDVLSELRSPEERSAALRHRHGALAQGHRTDVANGLQQQRPQHGAVARRGDEGRVDEGWYDGDEESRHVVRLHAEGTVRIEAIVGIERCATEP